MKINLGPLARSILTNNLGLIIQVVFVNFNEIQLSLAEPYRLANYKLCYFQMLINMDKSESAVL